MRYSRTLILRSLLPLVALSIWGCGDGPGIGSHVSGTPDGAVEILTLNDAKEIEHTEGQFLAAVDRDDQKLVVVDFWASWCGPCIALAPTLEKVKQEWGDKIEVVKVNVDENGPIAARLGVSGIPDVRIYRGGTQVSGFVGLAPKAEIDSILKSLE